MLAWSEGPITDVRNQKSWLWRHCRRRKQFTDYSDHPRKSVTLNLNSNQQAPDATSFFPLVDAYRKQFGLEKDFPTASGRCGIAQDWARRLPMIDRGDIRQAIDRCSNIHFTAGRWLCIALYKADSLIAKIKEAAERSERLMYEQSHRDYLRSAIRIIVCLSWAVNHYR